MPGIGYKISRRRKGSSLMEYMLVLLFIGAAFFVFQHYIVRGFSGRWKSVGDSFGSGKQYDPKDYSQGGTLECFYYQDRDNPSTNYWVATRCYETCLRNKPGLGFGYEPDMASCRTQCQEGFTDGAGKKPYQNCRNTAFEVPPL